MIRNIVAILSVLICNSCIINKSNFSSFSVSNCLDRIDEDLVDHFPIDEAFDLDSYYCGVPDTSIGLNFGVTITASYQLSDGIDSVIEVYSLKAVYSGIHFDSSFLILPIVDMSTRKIGTPRIKNTDSTLYPVANFKYELIRLDSVKLKYLPDDFILYIIDVQAGIYTAESNLYCENIMPQDWEHGYSKGVAISKCRQRLIYWLNIW